MSNGDLLKRLKNIQSILYPAKPTAKDTLEQEKVDIERRFLRGEKPKTIGERLYGEKLGILEKAEKPEEEYKAGLFKELITGEQISPAESTYVGLRKEPTLAEKKFRLLTQKEQKEIERLKTPEGQIEFKVKLEKELQTIKDPTEKYFKLISVRQYFSDPMNMLEIPKEYSKIQLIWIDKQIENIIKQTKEIKEEKYPWNP